VGERTARVILVTDSNSRLPVTIQPSGQKALLSGDNSPLPPLEFIEDTDEVRPGDRVVTSGDGEVFPAGLLVGQVVLGTDKRLRVVLAADYQRLEFLRVLRSHDLQPITDPGSLIAPPATMPLPDTSTEAAEAAAGAQPAPTEGGDVEAAGSGAAEGAEPEAGDG
jgi:rod shape-determining protein MreC